MPHPLDPLNDPRYQELIACLRAQAVPEPSADLGPRTLARLRQPAIWRRPFLAVSMRVAAAIALLLGAGWWWCRPAPVAAGPAPIDILMAAQRADGGWSADPQNQRPRYDVGVTALVLLALMETDPAPLDGPQAGAIRAGLAHLIRRQCLDGRFGDDFSGAGFTQYLAGMAMQTAARLPGADPAWQAAAVHSAPHVPPAVHLAKLNNRLAHSETFPVRWAEAGGPVAVAAIQILGR